MKRKMKAPCYKKGGKVKKYSDGGAVDLTKEKNDLSKNEFVFGAGVATDLLTYGLRNSKNNEVRVAGEALGGAGQGAMAGASFGPIGMGIGAAGGFVKGLITGIEKNKQLDEIEKKEKELKKLQTLAMASQTVNKTEYAQGGKVTGKGTSKSDSIKAKMKTGTFIVPAENAGIAEMLRRAYLPDKSGLAELEQKGGVNISVSNGEHSFTPNEVATLLKKGINLNALAPMASNSKKLKAGGTVEDDETININGDTEPNKPALSKSQIDKVKLYVKNYKDKTPEGNWIRGSKNLQDRAIMSLLALKNKTNDDKAVDAAIESLNPKRQKNPGDITTGTPYQNIQENVIADIYEKAGTNENKYAEEYLKWKKQGNKPVGIKTLPMVNVNTLKPDYTLIKSKNGLDPNDDPQLKSVNISPVAIPTIETKGADVNALMQTYDPNRGSLSNMDLPLKDVAKQGNVDFFPDKTENSNKLETGLAIAQMGMGLGYTLFNKRPDYEISPEIKSRYNKSLIDEEQAKIDAGTGFSMPEYTQASNQLELNRRTENAEIERNFGTNTGSTLAAKRITSLNKAKGIVDLAAADARLRLSKRQFIIQANARTDALANNMAAEEQKIYDADMLKFSSNQQAGAALLNAGLSNFIESRNYNKLLKTLG